MTRHSDDTTARTVTTVTTGDLGREEVGPGVTVRELPRSATGSAWIIDFAPGSEWPGIDHHESEERYYVLTGELIDGDRRHHAGDYVMLAQGTSHQPRTEVGASILVHQAAVAR